MFSKLNKLTKAAAALIFWIGIWALAAKAANQVLLIPSPLVVAGRLVSLAADGAFWQTAFVSLVRVFAGFAIGAAAGVLLAVVSAASPLADCLIEPAVRVIRATPVTSFIILVMLWLKYAVVPVFIAALLVAPIMYGNIRTGIGETDRGLLELAAVFKFGRAKTLKTVYIPSVLPYFYSGCLTSLGLAWKAGIAAEVLCLPSVAVGSNIYYSKLYLETPDLFAWTIVVILFSYIFEKLFGFLIGRKMASLRGGAK